MKHDPERSAAAYLGGLMSPRRRRTFESHIVDCEDCWNEVAAGRTGRAVAESARELARQRLRERVRTLESATPGHRRSPWVDHGTRARCARARVLCLLNRPPGPTAGDRAVVGNFESNDAVGGPIHPVLPRRLGDLVLVASEKGSVAGVAVSIHRYRDEAGHAVAVYRSDTQWPVAVGADHALCVGE